VSEESATPSGTVTFLFSDVQDSTRLWERDSSAMELALRRHDEILRASIGAHTGYVFSTAGDAFCAAFQEAASATSAAAAAQESLRQETWPAGTEIAVRMGLHTGTADERDGDYFGPTLNRAARLMSTAHRGQVVMTSVTAASLGHTHSLVDLGEHRLKDLGTPARVFQLGDDGEEQSFPPLRSLSVGRNNQPVQPDAFIGRADDVAPVIRRLDERRLVTLSALGGTGKTRLATQVAAEVSDAYRDGMWLVELDRATDATAVAGKIGRTLGFERRSGTDWVGTAAEWLSLKQTLLVLDNCEQVRDGAAELIDAVLGSAEGVQILVTSRQPLHVRGEAVISLSPLDPSTDAVDLFIERARESDDRFDADGERSAIEELCRQLDGLPLAIELAAARARTLRPAEMLGMLDRRFELLRSHGRDSHDRHRTLAATVEWSYEQLTEAERNFFDRLGIFAGPFTREAAMAVGGEDVDELAVIDLLDELESRNLIEVRHENGRNRYQLLETLASYAKRRLAERGLAGEVSAHHARYYMQECDRLLDGIERVDVDALADQFSFFSDHVEEIRRSLEWARDHEPHDAAAIAVRVLDLFMAVVDFREAYELIDGLESELAEYEPTGMLLSYAAIAHWYTADADRMERLADEVLGRPSIPLARAGAHTVLAVIAIIWRDDPELGLVHLDEASSYNDEIDPSPQTARMIGFEAVLCYHVGRPDRCKELYVRHIEPMLANHPLTEVATFEAGADAWRFDDLARSSELLRRAHHIAIRVGLGRTSNLSRYHLALNDRMAHDYPAALTGFVDSLSGLLDEGEVLALRLALEDLAAVLARLDRLEEAMICLGAGTAGLDGGPSGASVYVRRRERIRDQARNTLGSAAADAASERGTSMTIDEAVAWARKLTPAAAIDRPTSS
jgi:predicted ATPase/class 3 adenylate cyclase